MKPFQLLRQLFFCCLVAGILVPVSAWAAPIQGPTSVCQGETYTYTPPGTLNPNYNYTWTIIPASAGTVLTGNSTGASIQWINVGGATVKLTGTNPAAGNAVVYSQTLAVTVNSLPAPYITTETRLACQPLEDPKRKEGQGEPPKFENEPCLLVCEYSTVIYTAHGDPGSNFTWSAPGSVSISPSGNTCAVTWGAAGSGTVQVTESTVPGNCQATSSLCVEIIAGPIAKFYAMPDYFDYIEICKNGEVVLVDQSSSPAASPIVSWHWDFGDGTVSNESPGATNNPIKHQYTTPGSYTIVLTVTNSCGCTSKHSLKVRVMDEEAVKIACPRVVCEGETARYSVDKPCAPDSWKVIGGTLMGFDAQRADVLWDQVDPATGFGYIMYRSCDPCPNWVVVPVPVVLRNGKIQGPDVVCAGDQHVYRMPKWPTTKFTWSVTGNAIIQPTDQPNEIAVTAGASGSYTLTVTYCNTMLKCTGVAEMTVQIRPQAIISGPDLLCRNTNATYYLNGGYLGDWTLTAPDGSLAGSGFGNSFTGTFSLPGIYKLNAIGGAFCPPDQFLIKVNQIPATPSSIVGPDSACSGVPYLYSAGPPIAGTTFGWSVSGGGTANAPYGDNTYITFNGLPNYTITVFRMTTDAAQCKSKSIKKIVRAPVPPLVISGLDSVCHSTYHNYSLNYQGGDVYEWSVVPNTLGSVTSNGSTYNPTILWNVPTTPPQGESAWLIAKVRKCNSFYYDSIKVFVRGMPTLTAALAPGQNDTICSGDPVNFVVTPSFGISSVGNVHWEWGDGPNDYPTFTTNWTHTYALSSATSPVTYTPVITVTNPNGCLGTVTGIAPTIVVNPTPVAHVSPDGPIGFCGPVSQTLTATVTTGFGSTTNYQWFPGGPSGPLQTSWTVTALGSYYVKVSNSNGCVGTSNIVNIVNACPGTPCGPGNVPVLSGSASQNCGNVLINVSNGGGSNIIGTYWTYPVGASVNTQNATTFDANFTVAGNYDFFYNVRYTNFAGDTCIVTKKFTVLVPYIVNMKYSIACNAAGGNYKVTLFDNSNKWPSVTVTNNFYVNPPSASVGSGTSAVVYLAPGTYTLREVISGGGHPACTMDVVINLPALPVASFIMNPADSIPNPGCVNEVSFNFINTSTPSPSSLSSLWNFGDALNYQQNAGRVYSSVGPKTVTLTVTSIYGCTSVATMGVTVAGNPYAGSLTAVPNPTCQGTPVNLSYAPAVGFPSIPTKFTWYKESGPMFTTTTNGYQVFSPGGYWVMGKGNFGCKVKTDMVPVVINQVPAVNISGNDKQCINTAFKLTVDQIPGATYQWILVGSGPISGGTTPVLNQTIGSPGTYTYRVVMTYNGCTRTSPDFVVTVSSPTPPPSLSFSVLGCTPYELQLQASGPAGDYNWSNGMNGPVVQTYKGGPYLLTFTDLNGCVSTNSISTPKDPNEYLWIFPTGCFCRPQGLAAEGMAAAPAPGSCEGPPFITGPIIPFNYWAWLYNGSPASSGGGTVPADFIPPGQGIYNLELNNGYCTVKSGDMYYAGDTCKKLQEIKGVNLEMPGFKIGVSSGMQLVPNPAQEQSSVIYKFTEGSTNRSIEVYDMVGRKMQSHPVQDEKGSLILPLSGYAAGMYQVVMKENGKTVQQGKLAITR
jgi:PKD repeat protein